MTETVERTRNGAILYDKAIINQISDRALHGRGLVALGNTDRIAHGPAVAVTPCLSAMFRVNSCCGTICAAACSASLSRDTYIFSGEDLTRSFLEWRLLDKLAANNMNVPRPAAARFCRRGTFYTADIITVRIPDVVSLSEYIATKERDEAFWQSLGAAIWKFHHAGVYHADMNAYNVQVDKDGDIWMLDFDKGELKAPGPWQQQTLGRLHRSLKKVLGMNPKLNFRGTNWEQLLQGYFNASRSA